MAEYYQDAYVRQCPFCGGTEMIETFQSAMRNQLEHRIVPLFRIVLFRYP